LSKLWPRGSTPGATSAVLFDTLQGKGPHAGSDACWGTTPRRLPKTRLKLFLPTNPPKKTNEISGAQQAKIRASKDVLDIEIWGDRIWQPAISSDGVLIVIGRLRARALVERSGGAS
jgi:hypothetical protein